MSNKIQLYLLQQMNYISKIILQQLLPQFVQVPFDSLNVQQSGIKLSKGQVKKDKYNPTLQKIGIKIDKCSYTNILVQIPWMEMFKKPIKINIEELRGELRLLNPNTNNAGSDRSIPQIEEQISETSSNPSVSAEYLKTILKKLLFNMEIKIKSIVFGVKNQQQLNLTLNIQNINIKNSKLSEDSSNIIKTVVVEKMSICFNGKPLLELKGFNLCLDAGDEHVKAICLLNSVFVMIDFKELRMIKDSITQFTTKPASRKNSLQGSIIQDKSEIVTREKRKSIKKQSPQKPKKEKEKQKQVEKTMQIFVKVFEVEIVLCVSEVVSVSVNINNIQFKHTIKNKTKTKLSLTSFKIKQKQSIIFGIKSSKDEENGKYFINYSNIEQKLISDPQLQIETITQQHTSIKLYYVQLYGTEKLFQLLQLHLKSIIQNIAYLTSFPQDERQPVSSTSIQQISPPASQQPSTLMTTVMIYYGMINIYHQKEYYKLYLSIQYVTDNGCLYQFDTLQISIRNTNVEILRVFDSQISITEDQIYVRIEIIQIQIWNKAIFFFKDLVEGIVGIVNAVNQQNNSNQQTIQNTSNKQLKQKAQQITHPQSQYKYIILVRNCKVVLGNIITKQQTYRFIDLIQLSIKDIKIVLSNPNSIQCGAVIHLVFTDQHTLLQQSISNPIHISFQNIHSKDVSVQLLNNVTLKLQSRYLKYIFNTINQSSTYISITNFTKRKLKIACQGCASIEIEPKVNTNWFPLVRNFRLESYQGKPLTNYTNLDFEMDIDKEIELNDSKERIILRLVKSRISSYHLLIKPSFKVINCVNNMTLVYQKLKLNTLLKSSNYQEIDFEDQYSSLHKSQDIHDLEKIVNTASEDEIVFQDSSKELYKLKELVSKDDVTLFALQSKLYFNYSCYAMKKNNLLVIMPFLSLKNNTTHKIKIVIQQKKTSETLDVILEPHSQFIASNNSLFDFYMRQLTIKVSFQSHESEAYYFNTFAFLSQFHQQIIPLRSSQKGIHERRHIIIKQTAKLRSKYLEFNNPTTIVNNCQFDLSVKIDQRGIILDKQIIKSEDKTHICIGLKGDYLILMYFQDQVETKVSVECSKLKSSPHVISFNFCKINDKFKNVLVSCQLTKEGENEVLTFKPFVTLMNLTSIPIKLNQQQLFPNKSCSLSLVINSDHTFNNRAIKLQPQSATQLFQLLLKNMEDKSQDNQTIEVGGSKILLNEFIHKTLLQVTKLPDKRILRMVKDTYHKISLYVIEGIHLDSADCYKYSLINNNTDYHYLLSEQPIFEGLFGDNQQKHTHKLKKLLIKPRTTSTIIPKSNYNILLCDSRGQKLNELNSQTMQLKQIQQQKNPFQRVQIKSFEQKVSQFKGQQLKIKTIQVELSLDGELFLILHIKNLKLRRLQKTKFDLLINQLILKDVKKGVNVVGLKQNNYAILDFQIIGDTVCLIRNMFVKFGLIQIDLRKQFLFNVIRFTKNFNKQQPKHLLDTKVQKQSNSREESLIEVIRSKLFLIKNLFVEQFAINTNLELDALVFSNQLIMPMYKLSSTTIRQKKFMTELWKFYSSSLVSKFPKLSFLIQNLRHPLNIIKNIYNLRETLKSKTIQKLTYWSNANKYSPALLVNQLPLSQVVVWIINSVDRILIFSNKSLLLQQYTPIPCRPTKLSLSSIKKISYNPNSIEISMSEGNQIQISILKRDQRVFNSIISYLIQ